LAGKFLLPSAYLVARIFKCGVQEIFAKNCALLVVVKLPLLTVLITQKSALLSYFVVVPKSLLHGIPITATAQDHHLAQYLRPHKIPHGPNDSPPPQPKKSSTLHIAILAPHNWP